MFPLAVAHLTHSNYVVHTYAAVCIERILFMKQADSNVFTQDDLAPYTEQLLQNLFALIEQGKTPEKISENDYLMKTVVRVLYIARERSAPFAAVVLGKLTGILSAIS